nr:hypothetical protein [Tanacetum cinerariifolium]
MILESVEHGPLLWPTVEEDRVTRLKKYSELSTTEAIQADCDVAKDLWERIQMLMQGTSLTKQERECKLYDEIDKFAYQKGETLRDFYLRFSLLLNDMNMYNMKLEQFQVNTKFLNTLPPEWIKFVTDVRLVRVLHTTNVDQLHAYLGQHEYHANEQQASTYQTSPYATSYHTPQFISQGPSSSTHLISYPVNDTSSLVNHNAYMASSSAPQIDYAPMVQHSLEYSPHETGLVLRTSSNPRQQATINNGRVTIRPVQGRQNFLSAGSSRPFTSGSGGAPGKQRVIMCYNCKGEGHMSKQCTKPKRKRDAEWFKDKVLLVQAQANGQIALTANLSHYGSDNLAEKTQVVTCIKINQDNKHVNELLTAELERYKNQERVLNELKHDDKVSTSYESSQEIESLKHTLSEHLKEKQSLEQKITILQIDFQKEESRNIDRELALEKQLKPKLYDGRIIEKSDAVVIPDTEETLMFAEESSKMIGKQNDPQMTEKKVITKPINYAILNQLSTDFETRFVPQIELSVEQAFWSQYSVQTDEPILSATTTIVEVPKELPKVSMVNSCLKKLKSHLASFDMVDKERTTATVIMEGTWGFEHNKACFCDDIIPFVKALKELFTSFDQCLIDEVTEVQNIFKQIELAVEQHREEKNKFQNRMENVLQENDRLLTQALSVEIVNVVVYDNKNTLSSSESAPTFAEFVKINELKAQAQAKDTVILQLKEKLRSLKGDVTERNVKREVEEIKTLNIELDHKVTKLVVEIEHLKQTYKQLYDSIKSLRVRSKEQCDDLINKVNLKSAEVSDLNASLQEKVLVITSLKEQLNKLKGKAILTEAVSLNPIDPELLKVDVAPLVPKLHKNRTAHTDYISHTQDEAATLREIVESKRLLSPLNTSLDYACKYTRQIQELLMILQQTCPILTKLGTKLVAVTPKNKTK